MGSSVARFGGGRQASAECVNFEWKECKCIGVQYACRWCHYGSGCIVLCTNWGLEGLCA
ncbi:hypothetical protein [Phytomonospora endophytica]|uniref:Uncharacterized protein n=1 Tax=Phytomonospora endophytica TaxID=714109 RepID=A0A841F665_9ACTN|nr:hypothetical protein [Phytomonospora endophytica]MBB6032421.1 hypothetical protein [Phytomonospora endophytica]GIG66433.1 hypothetical protein Pen01_27280 [Phytomonospora endophytica]